MNTICRTCGTTLQSGISRDYGQCGACRVAEENAPPPQEGKERVSPWHPQELAPDALREKAPLLPPD